MSAEHGSAPEPRRFIVQDTCDLDVVERNEGLSAWLREATARALADLDRQVADHLRRMPPGARLCVHSPEAMTEDDPADPADRFTLRWRQRVHELDERGTCPRDTGDRYVYTVPEVTP